MCTGRRQEALSSFSAGLQHGACRDEWIAPAIEALGRADLVLEAAAVLSQSCGLPSVSTSSHPLALLLCLSNAEVQGAQLKTFAQSRGWLRR